ncbi:hypothetical protein HYPSUDRAFT_68580 [Hypholoma sublateritium FD-334 SS-4]|uniref:F-box domain-containing protein n=1 Tax=Hypholoma sublateritium (strain FD-334 SS-4) TaxID=945553 RepID=A0A0D2L133_HYPSF|nr:hypothetical protein HYPSUDRAFT_68580 [Hypholoma sublateritium FD-334 SS-4]
MAVIAPPTLPSELIEAIIEQVGAKDDITTLKQCALVSKDFVHDAQKVLFRTIDLDRRLPRKKYYIPALPPPAQRQATTHRRLRARAAPRRRRREDCGTDESWITTTAGTTTGPATRQLRPRVGAFSLSFNAQLTS